MDVPVWFGELAKGGKILEIEEWDKEHDRNQNGFQGFDFCHSENSPVRIMQYVLLTEIPQETGGDPQYRLIAPVYFSPRAESGRGYCHGGTMCAVMDDAIGWMGFCCTGEAKPWAGFTVQVNTSLKKSIPVGSTLLVEAWIDRFEGSRKVWIGSRLSNPVTKDVHCEGTGLFLRSQP